MYSIKIKLFGKILLLLAFVIMCSTILDAQNSKNIDRFNYKHRTYHIKSGWINTVGLHTGNWDEIIVSIMGIPELQSLQVDYQLYNLVHPRIGLGGGAALNLSPTEEYGYEEFGHYKFAEFYAYGKYYLNDNRRRLFVDVKAGYAYAVGVFEFNCYSCNGEGPLYLRYNSGSTIHAGIGLDFATSKALKYGIKLSFYRNAFTQQYDIYPTQWIETPVGLIKRRTSDKVLRRFLLGFNFYI